LAEGGPEADELFTLWSELPVLVQITAAMQRHHAPHANGATTNMLVTTHALA
jgi:hypothetical protein